MGAAAPGLMRITMTSTTPVLNQQIVNTFHLADGTVNIPDATVLDGVLADLDTLLTADYRDFFPTTETFTGYTASQVPDPVDPEPYIQRTLPLSLAGTGAGSRTSPIEVCRVLKFSSAVVGRRAKGRMFLPPCILNTNMTGENFISGVAYDTTTLAFVALLETLLASSGAHAGGSLSTWDLSIYSRTGRTQDDPFWVFAVGDITAPLRVHWLRSRGRGGS